MSQRYYSFLGLTAGAPATLKLNPPSMHRMLSSSTMTEAPHGPLARAGNARRCPEIYLEPIYGILGAGLGIGAVGQDSSDPTTLAAGYLFRLCADYALVVGLLPA